MEILGQVVLEKANGKFQEALLDSLFQIWLLLLS